MPTSPNRQIVLAKRPHGDLGPECFSSSEAKIPTISEGQALLKLKAVVMDPAIRLWMTSDSYMPAIEIGEPIRSGAAGEVIESRTDRFPVGSYVTGLFSWSDYAVADASRIDNLAVLPGTDPLVSLALTTGSGPTAYFGLLEIGQPKSGETVVVSGAAGSVGSVVGQIARIKGCRVVGFAGTQQKCDHVVNTLGFDACINYRQDDIDAALKELCPKGIDVYFDNVGGEILNAALKRLANRARVVACGAISQYSEVQLPWPKYFPTGLINRRARMEGFNTIDYLPRFPEAAAELTKWLTSKDLVYPYEIADGIHKAPEQLMRLFSGDNVGKLLVTI